MQSRCLLPPTTEPVSVEHLKAHLRVQHDAEDGLIRATAMAAREEFERLANRAILSQTWELSLDDWCSEIRLPRPPLQRVLSVSYRDANGATQTLPTTQYEVDATSEPGRIVPAYGVTWPTLYTAPNVVTIRYVAGFATPVTIIPIVMWSDTLTSAGRDFINGEMVTLSFVAEEMLMFPSPLSSAQLYYVVGASGANFCLSLSPGGAVVLIDGTHIPPGQLFVGRIPEGIRAYIKMMVAHWYENREAITVGNSVNEIPMAAESLFQAYRIQELV
jgi:uncharacterized phiE125 gp8 family phage protein